MYVYNSNSSQLHRRGVHSPRKISPFFFSPWGQPLSTFRVTFLLPHLPHRLHRRGMGRQLGPFQLQSRCLSHSFKSRHLKGHYFFRHMFTWKMARVHSPLKWQQSTRRWCAWHIVSFVSYLSHLLSSLAWNASQHGARHVRLGQLLCPQTCWDPEVNLGTGNSAWSTVVDVTESSKFLIWHGNLPYIIGKTVPCW